MVKPKTFNPNLLHEQKDISGPEFFFIFAFFKPKLSLNRGKTANPLRFGLTVLFCIYQLKLIQRYFNKLLVPGGSTTTVCIDSDTKKNNKIRHSLAFSSVLFR